MTVFQTGGYRDNGAKNKNLNTDFFLAPNSVVLFGYIMI